MEEGRLEDYVFYGEMLMQDGWRMSVPHAAVYILEKADEVVKPHPGRQRRREGRQWIKSVDARPLSSQMLCCAVLCLLCLLYWSAVWLG